jgi:cell division protein FtsX
VVLLANSFLVGKIRGSMPFMAVPLDAVPSVIVTLLLLGVGVIIGALGSGIGLRRFLKV